MPRIGGRRKKTRTHKEPTEQEITRDLKTPKSFIIKRGRVPQTIKETIRSMREVMYPNTAMKLRESGRNKLKDYLSAAGGFGVTHMMLFSSTDEKNYIRFCKLPDGPTVTFRILQYSTESDIRNSQRKPKAFPKAQLAPLLILNGFPQFAGGDSENSNSHYSIVHSMLQSMFPPLDPLKVKVDSMRKAVLFSLDQNLDVVEFRYYGIKYAQAGINKKIRNLVQSKAVPNLGKYNDISDYVLRDDYFSEVDMEEIQTVEDSKSKTTKKISIRLSEIGPRMQLRLIKIEEGVLKGNVVYHRLIKKTPQEIEKQRNRLKEKQKRKEAEKKKLQKITNEKMKAKLEKKKRFKDEENQAADEEEEEEEKQGEYEDDENDYEEEGDGGNNMEEEEEAGEEGSFEEEASSDGDKIDEEDLENLPSHDEYS